MVMLIVREMEMWPCFLKKEKTYLVSVKPVSAKCGTILDKTDEIPTCMEHPFWYSMIDNRHVNIYVNNS